MASLIGLARERTDLSDDDVAHLLAVVSDWTLLADLAFGDLVMWLPTWNDGGFVAGAQVRPSTGPTQVPDDVVGRFLPRGRRPDLDAALASARTVRDRAPSRPLVPRGPEAIPVRRDGTVVAVVSRHSWLPEGRGDGQLERAYLRTADDLVVMLSEGTFPPGEGLATTDAPPRVGDGMLRVSPDGHVEFASPNAVSAFHRLGLAVDLVGSDLPATVARLTRRPGPVDEALAVVASGRAAGGAEIENSGAVVTLRSLPLRPSGRVNGAVVLVRDVTDLRRRERALLTKDATIREIHHRVKNNLQTVAALLRLQARRIDAPEAREALDEAVRRVGAIAVVHETLARAPGETVSFDDVADRLIAMAADTAAALGVGSIRREGSFGTLSTDLATPLAMALTELLQNAVEHGLRPRAEGRSGPGTVLLTVHRSPGSLVVHVDDDGEGLPAGFDPVGSAGLGLQIVRTLVEEDLAGQLLLSGRPSGTGTRADIRVPLRS